MVDLQSFKTLAQRVHPDELFDLIERLPEKEAEQLAASFGTIRNKKNVPETPFRQAREIIPNFAARDHLMYLSHRIKKALEDVENGIDRRLIVEMPPRSGKSTIASQIAPAWILNQHPDWDIALASYSHDLAVSWGRQIRRWAEAGYLTNVHIAEDSGKAEGWETTAGGKLISRALGGGTTGFGAKVLVIDDPHKDFIDAHSAVKREQVWQWWLNVGSTRLHPPSLVVVIQTRWHEDDLVGRLLSREYPGDPNDWEVIRFPAIAGDHDVLGREPGDPLYSPLAQETREEALERWERVRRDVGSYTWNALYQQNPSQPEGSIFMMDTFRYWTTDPNLADMLPDGTPDPDGKTVLIEENYFNNGDWLDSWDCAFKGTEDSDFVVGQRWVRVEANRYLIAQQRNRWSFSQTLAGMRAWAETSSPYGHLVHKRAIEEAANGAAIIDSLKNEISGLKPIKARNSKEARARAITPEIESGNVFLPHPAQAGYEWVNDLLSELREFPTGKYDDQVDALTQALAELRPGGRASIVLPGNAGSINKPIPGLHIPR